MRKFLIVMAFAAIGLAFVPVFADDPAPDPATSPTSAPDPSPAPSPADPSAPPAVAPTSDPSADPSPVPAPEPAASEDDLVDPDLAKQLADLEAEVAEGEKQLATQLTDAANAAARATIDALQARKAQLAKQLADPNSPVDLSLTDPALTTETSTLEAEVAALEEKVTAKRKDAANAATRAKIAALQARKADLAKQLAPPAPPAPPTPAVQPPPTPAPVPTPTPAPAGPKTTPGTYNK